jgi:hypothetical protein
MPTKTLNTWDVISPRNAEQIAKTLTLSDPTTSSMEDCIAVINMMSTRIKWEHKSQWDAGGIDFAPWYTVSDARRGWGAFPDLLRGASFLGCLTRCLDFAGSGNAEARIPHPKWDATPAEIISAVRAGIIEGAEDDGEDDFTLDEDDEAILNLPPVIIVAVHLRMEARFMECIREDPDLIIDGSVESIQRDIQKRWGKVVEAIVESRREGVASA